MKLICISFVNNNSVVIVIHGNTYKKIHSSHVFIIAIPFHCRSDTLNIDAKLSYENNDVLDGKEVHYEPKQNNNNYELKWIDLTWFCHKM